jgi:hypothetical protein
MKFSLWVILVLLWVHSNIHITSTKCWNILNSLTYSSSESLAAVFLVLLVPLDRVAVTVLFSPTVPGGLISALFLLATQVLGDATDVGTTGTAKCQIYEYEESTEAVK